MSVFKLTARSLNVSNWISCKSKILIGHVKNIKAIIKGFQSLDEPNEKIEAFGS